LPPYEIVPLVGVVAKLFLAEVGDAVPPGLGRLVEVGDLLAATLLDFALTAQLSEVAIPESYPLSGGCGVQRGVEPPVVFDVLGIQGGRKVAQLLRQLGSPSLVLIAAGHRRSLCLVACAGYGGHDLLLGTGGVRDSLGVA
jgi:hypothetical protein